MSFPGRGQRVRIYLGESDLWQGQPLYLALLERLRAEGTAGATVLRGIAGFGAHSRIHTAAILRLSEDLPIVIDWVDTPERIARVLPSLTAMLTEGLVTVEEVEIRFYQHRPVQSLASQLTVGEIMTAAPVTVRPDSALAEAVRLLVNQDFRALPVVDASGHVVGIVTSSDLVERGGLRLRIELLGALSATQLAHELAALEEAKTVAAVMTQPVVTVGPDTNLADAAHLMVTHHLKRLPVVNPAGELLGMVSRADLLRTRSDAYPRTLPELMPRPGQTIGDAMRTDVPVVRASARLGEVLDAVVSTRLNRAIVVDDQRRVVGVVTDGDLLRRLSPEDRPSVIQLLMSRLPFVHLSPAERERLAHAQGTTASQLMGTGVPTAPPDLPLGEAIKIMIANRRKLLPVVDAAGRLLGAADRADLLRTLVKLDGE